jgi:hypothetical protein
MNSHPPVETESYTAFRLRLVLDTILPTFVLPPVFCATVLRVLSSKRIHTNIVGKSLAYLASIPLFLFVRIQLRRRKQRLEAQRLGAREVPRVRGKWPGNIDVLINALKAPQKVYIWEGPKERFNSLGSKTVNIDMLWKDMVRGVPTTPSNMIRFHSST